MTDPRRWLDEAPSALTRELLSSAHADGDDPAAKQRLRSSIAAGAMGVAASIAGQAVIAPKAGVAASGGASVASGGLTAAAKGGVTLTVAKWTGIAAVAIAAGSAAIGYVSRVSRSDRAKVDGPRATSKPTAAAPTTAPAPNPPLEVTEAPHADAVPRAAAPRRQPIAPTPSPGVSASNAKLAEEIAAVDAARRGAARGDLAALDSYLARYPNGAFRAQVLALRAKARARDAGK